MTRVFTTAFLSSFFIDVTLVIFVCEQSKKKDEKECCGEYAGHNLYFESAKIVQDYENEKWAAIQVHGAKNTKILFKL